MSQTSTRRRTGAAGVATGALVASALLFAPSAQAAISDVRESQIAPNETTYAGWHQGVDGGKAQVVNEGLKLIDRSQVINGYSDNSSTVSSTKNLDLSTIDAAYTVKSGQASFQLPVFVDADGPGEGASVFTTLRSPLSATGGTIAPNAANWESSKAIGTTPANTPTSLDQIVAGFGPNATYKVIAFGVYSDATSVVSDIRIGSDTYTFKNNAPVAANRTVSTKINTGVNVPLSASDVDGNTLTYTVGSPVGGTVSGSGTSASFTPAKDFRGNASFKYTVTDDRGGSTTATVTVKVEKLKGKVDIYRIHPTRPSIRSTVYVYATVSIDGKKASKGSTVYGYAKGKKVVTGKVNSSGKVKLKLPNKLPYGKATLKVTQAGSTKLSGGSDSIAVRVKK